MMLLINNFNKKSNYIIMLYLKQFIIGSSYLVFFPFYIGFNKLKRPHYSYFNYTILAPIWFGIFNIISIIIANKLNLSCRKRFILISIISYLLIVTYAKYNNVYNFSEYEWYKYYIGMFILYLFTWNIIIYNIEKYI